MTDLERRETRLLRNQRAAATYDNSKHPHYPPFSENDKDNELKPDAEHYHMAEATKYYQDLFSFARNFGDDLATKVCLP